jgi:mono/diheme cytochrome c family protein
MIQLALGRKRSGSIWIALCLVLPFFCFDGTAQSVDYARQVQPILHQRCAQCHGEEAPQGGLSLLTQAGMLKGGKNGPAIVPGSSQKSLLVQHLTGEKKPLMPMGQDPLPASEIAVLKSWIDQGAAWDTAAPASTAWKPTLAPRQPALPEVSGRFENPIDRFIAAYFQKYGRTFSPVVPDAVFARRAYLDVWGLLPTPAQLARFVNDTQPGKRERLVDALLSDRKNYSEHWISFWNDLLRNDEGVVYHGERQTITIWLLKALEDNVPYNQFVTALLNPEKPEDPRGYLIGVNWRGDVSASQIPPVQAAQNSAQVFMGVNLKCASCHDSFINQWKLRDSYGLASFFSEKELELVRCDVKLGERAQAKFLYPELGGVETAAPLAERRAAAARLMTLPQNGRLTRTLVNRYWKKLFGRGLVEPVDDMDQQPWNADLLDWLASDFADHGYDLKHLLRRILTSQTYQLPAIHSKTKESKDFVFNGPWPRRLTAEEVMDAVSSVTGEWRVLEPKQGDTGTYSREWRLKSSALTRSLGRPIRDQVFTTRNEDPSTLQALELVNGEDLTYLLQRGAERMLGKLTPAPMNRFDSGAVAKGKVDFDIDVSGARELWLLTEDAGSYDRSLVVAGWADARLIGPGGERPVAELVKDAGSKPLSIAGQLFSKSLVTPISSSVVVDLTGKGFTRFQGSVGVDESSLRSDISPRVRFFVFSEKPDPRRLVKVSGGQPVPFETRKFTADELVGEVYQHLLSREPSPKEKAIGREFLMGAGQEKKLAPDGLEDLLWAVCLLPEFQFIQ